MNKSVTNFRLTLLQRVIYKGAEYEVFGKTPNGWNLINKNRAWVEILDSELFEMITSRKLSIIGNAACVQTDEGLLEGTQCIAVQDPDAWKEALLQEEYVKMFEQTKRGFRSGERLQERIDELALTLGDKSPPKPRTVREWAKEYREGGRCTEALVCIQTRRHVPRKRKTNQQVIQATQDYFKYYQATPSQVRSKAIREARQHLEKVNAKIVPSEKTFYRRFNELEDQYNAIAKFGKSTGRRMYRGSTRTIKADRPMELLMLDSTRLNVGAKFGKKRRKRPWLTLVTDAYSHYPVGYYLGFRHPSSWTSIEALKCAILPKTWIKKQFPDIVGEWVAYGMPENVLTDNGSENKGAFRDACGLLGIDYSTTPVKSPYSNGMAERLGGRCNELLQHLPGSVGSDVALIYEKGGLRDECLELRQIEQELLKIFIEELQENQHTTLGEHPGAVWLRGLAEFKVRPPCNMEKLDTLSGEQFERGASPDGIKHHGIRYNSSVLQQFRLRDARPRHPDETPRPRYKVLIYQNDVTKIQVYNTADRHFYPVEAIDTDLYDGLSRYEHALIHSRAREFAKKKYPGSKFRNAYSRADYLRAKTEILSGGGDMLSAAHREALKSRPTRLSDDPAKSRSTADLMAGDDVQLVTDVDLSDVSVVTGVSGLAPSVNNKSTKNSSPKPKTESAVPTPLSADQFTTLESD